LALVGSFTGLAAMGCATSDTTLACAEALGFVFLLFVMTIQGFPTKKSGPNM
jgi:hypothetical protein